MQTAAEFARPAVTAGSSNNAEMPLAIVVNCGSGHQETQARIETLRRVMLEAGRRHEIWRIDEEHSPQEVAAHAVDWAVTHSGAVVAAGGDGTLNTLAQAVLPTGRPMGVVPQGTFNYFARSHGLATDTEEAARQLLAARPRPVQVGLLNDRVFLVNASLGLYPQLLQDREAFKRQFGRYRFNAMLAALGTILRHHHEWTLELELGDRSVTVRTATLFVSNNRLQVEQLGLPEAAAAGAGALAAVMVRPVGRLGMLGLALRGALGRLAEASNAVDFAFRRLTVSPGIGRRARRLQAAIDGEVLWLHTPLTFTVSPTPLQLLSTAPESTA
ncbi:diacylglycerol/lipid kinase family protein [Azohydromonas caseinilytica]|uniref:Diacylglycerol kinase n=1 Tax=Azohydromonas caseinilytica TaxID=2728836 RepID=A0A848FM47_9BURK|nr:diacylglycerol kinase family protein [Azohydromonas caseinilytica]NML18851.1 diacylglycerol kinase [Azohydromonas caseinilytica]